MASPKILRASIRPGRAGLIIFGAGIIAGGSFRAFSPVKSESQQLNTATFIPFTIVSKEDISSTSCLFRLRAQKHRDAVSEAVTKAFAGGIWSIQIKQPQLQIARNYTPLPSLSDDADDQDLSLLIRREKGGEVSNYLHDLPERSTISLRGPYTELEIPNDIVEIVFLAGGTGIAPALQVANLLKTRKHLNMRILWANRKREDCVGGISDDSASRTRSVSGWFAQTRAFKNSGHEGSTHDSRGLMVQALEDLKRLNGRLEVNYFVDEENLLMTSSNVSDILAEGPPTETSKRRLILISGPDGFVEYWAGKKVWANGQETQGPLRGQLGTMNLKDWMVIKI